jgi:sarcosine oxidase subunit gamma
MVELMRRSSVEGAAELKLRSSVKVEIVEPHSRFNLRVGPEGAGEAGAAFGRALPMDACRANEAGEKAALWLGPDEWLLIGPEGSEIGPILAPHSLVDISHRQMALDVTGTRVEDLLATGVLIDLRLAGFPVGMCVRTQLGKAEVVLWRRGPQRFHVEVWRSFAPYVHEFLTQASAGL